MKSYSVDYFDRATELDLTKGFGPDRAAAMRFAARMSDKNDTVAYVVVSDIDPDKPADEVAVGHIVYWAGHIDGREGVTA